MDESELIDNYLRNLLEVEELNNFEKRIANDTSFKAKVEMRRILIESIHSAYQDELKVKLGHLDKKMDDGHKLAKNKYMIAASITLLIVASIGILVYNSYRTKTKFETYDIYDGGIPNHMGTSDNINLSAAMDDFKSASYSEAMKKFEAIQPSDTVLYYSGISAYRSGNVNQAIDCFKRINQDSEYYIKANYRLGLALWKNKQIDLAIPAFMKAAQDSTNEYGKYASLILTQEF